MVVTPNETPANSLTLTAIPLGVVLGMALPCTKTTETGFYHFEHLPLGRYAVYADDKEAGYSVFSTGAGGAGYPPEVELTDGHVEAELNVHLPPPAGFLLFHLTNRSTGAPISGIGVTVMSQGVTPKIIFSGSFDSTEAILVPSDLDLLLHVTSSGFQEWEESVGAGKPIHIAPAGHLTLDVRLQPSNPLSQRIPSADPKKHEDIRDAKN